MKDGTHRVGVTKEMYQALYQPEIPNPFGNLHKFHPWKDVNYAPSILKQCKITKKSAPYAVVGDYNCDGKPDLMLKGWTATEWHEESILEDTPSRTLIEVKKKAGFIEFTLCLLSDGIIYRVIEIKRGERQEKDGEITGYEQILELAKPGTYKSPWEDKPLNIKCDAVTWIYWGKASGIYYLSGDVFKGYTTGD